jgi:hypothetical protein
MKKIVIEGCGECPEATKKQHKSFRNHEAFCGKTLADLDISWTLNPYYFHPDCPLEDNKTETVIDQIQI